MDRADEIAAQQSYKIVDHYREGFVYFGGESSLELYRHTIKRMIADAWRQYVAEAVAAERERCAEIIDQVRWLSPKIAAQIREGK